MFLEKRRRCKLHIETRHDKWKGRWAIRLSLRLLASLLIPSGAKGGFKVSKIDVRVTVAFLYNRSSLKGKDQVRATRIR